MKTVITLILVGMFVTSSGAWALGTQDLGGKPKQSPQFCDSVDPGQEDHYE